MVISSLNSGNYTGGFEHMSRPRWSCRFMNSYVRDYFQFELEKEKHLNCTLFYVHSHTLLCCAAAHISIIIQHTMRSENVFMKAIANSQHAYQGCFRTYPPQTQQHLYSQSECNVKTTLYSPEST